jgi:tetratricopeptide (TPR) repeat protein
LGEAYRANQRWQEAQSAYDKALAMDPNLPAAHLGLGLMWMTSADTSSPEAEIPSLQKALQEFKSYRSLLGAKLSKNDPTEYYLANLQRRIERAERTMARDKRRLEQQAQESKGQ